MGLRDLFVRVAPYRGGPVRRGPAADDSRGRGPTATGADGAGPADGSLGRPGGQTAAGTSASSRAARAAATRLRRLASVSA